MASDDKSWHERIAERAYRAWESKGRGQAANATIGLGPRTRCGSSSLSCRAISPTQVPARSPART
jgi:hypothetical protein